MNIEGLAASSGFAARKAKRTKHESTLRGTMAGVAAETEEDEHSQATPRSLRRRSAVKKPARKAIPAKVQNVLWGRAAGRCQYAGCNKLLIGEQISGARNANRSYIAHIVGDSPDGPRGDPILSPKLAQDPDNMMLVCDEHHRVMDREMVDCACRKSNPDILVVQPAENWAAKNVPG
jgi:hypothetical protein